MPRASPESDSVGAASPPLSPPRHDALNYQDGGFLRASQDKAWSSGRRHQGPEPPGAGLNMQVTCRHPRPSSTAGKDGKPAFK